MNPDNNSSNPSLLGFLQKKSLFSNETPNKHRNRSRSHSKEGRFMGARSNVYQLEDRTDAQAGQKFNYQEDNASNYDRNQPSQHLNDAANIYGGGGYSNDHRGGGGRGGLEPGINELKPYQSTLPSNLGINVQMNERHYQSNLPRSEIRGAAETRGYNLSGQTPVEFRSNQQPDDRFFKGSQFTSNNYEGGRSTASRPGSHNPNPYQNQGNWANLVSQTHNFQSSRLQSIQCLQSLSGRLAGEISNISFKLDSFTTIMSRTLNAEFRTMRQKIMQTVDSVFKESDKFIRDYMKQQESKMAGEMSKMREGLIREHAKIEVMKEELKKANWRKVAGEILTTELQKRVEESIRNSHQLQLGHWQLGDLGGSVTSKIESQLRQMVRIKPVR